MPRIALIGAGSQVFAKTLVSDILSYPALADGEIALMDVDPDRLEPTVRAAETMAEEVEADPTIEATTDRAEALEGADYVVTTITVGGLEPFENEIRIPESYGVEQAIGDTVGPGGIFRGLRTVPTLVDIAEDMEELCPDALLLNYTNPMAICCWAIDAATDVDVIGLCHSVQHTAAAIADYVEVPESDLDHWVAGINHMAWFLEAEVDGESVLPALREAMDDPDTYERDTVRFEMFDHFGAFATESSHHLSEYVPYFRTDPGTIEAMTGTGYAERMATATYLEGWRERIERLEAEGPPFDPEAATVERSDEYGARVIHSMETGEVRKLNLNVPNEAGAVANLPEEALVEVPCLVDGTGVHPCAVGELPPQLAALCRSNVAVQERAVTGALEGDREAAHQAVKLDPLTAAELTLDEIHEMTEELIAANEAWLPDLA
ncbi:MAG: alpha-galactosidase [Haloarculaceae archaeon]